MTLNSSSVFDPNNGASQSIVNSNKSSYNYNNGIENSQHTFPAISNNWFDKTEGPLDQVKLNVQNINQNVDSKKCDSIFGTDDSFWADVENREILPPESFQNDSLQVAMNNLQISDEVSSKL